MLRMMYRRACLYTKSAPVLLSCACRRLGGKSFCVPLCLVGLKDLSLGVIAQGSDIDEAAQIKLLGAEHRHDGRVWWGTSMMKLVARCCACREPNSRWIGFGRGIAGGDNGSQSMELVSCDWRCNNLSHK